MDYRLIHNRAKLVKKYRANPSPWPDGIDHPGNRWYGDGVNWPEDKVELWASPGWLDDQLRGVTRVTPVTGDVTQPVTLAAIEPTKADLRRQQVKERVRRFRANREKRDAGS
jgi:hypothetical protein